MNLKASAKDIDNPWNLAEPYHTLVGNIPDVALAEEWKEVMFAQTKKINISHDDHLIIFHRKQGPIEELVDVLLIPLRKKREGLGDALWSLSKPTPVWILTEEAEQMLDDLLDIGCSAIIFEENGGLLRHSSSSVHKGVTELTPSQTFPVLFAIPSRRSFHRHPALSHVVEILLGTIPDILEKIVTSFNDSNLFKPPQRNFLNKFLPNQAD